MKLNKTEENEVFVSFFSDTGIPVFLTSTAYLQGVIKEKIKNPESTLGKAIEKVAKEHNKTSSAVSRSLDRIVKDGAENMTPKIKKDIFYGKKVSLGRYVAYAAYQLRNKL